MSKIPELKTFADPDGHDTVGEVVVHPASTSRCVSNVLSVGLLDPNSAKAGRAKTVTTAPNVAKKVRTISSPAESGA
jgi:hypothetical protein